jgi:hypothetical protein
MPLMQKGKFSRLASVRHFSAVGVLFFGALAGVIGVVAILSIHAAGNQSFQVSVSGPNDPITIAYQSNTSKIGDCQVPVPANSNMFKTSVQAPNKCTNTDYVNVILTAPNSIPGYTFQNWSVFFTGGASLGCPSGEAKNDFCFSMPADGSARSIGLGIKYSQNPPAPPPPPPAPTPPPAPAPKPTPHPAPTPPAHPAPSSAPAASTTPPGAPASTSDTAVSDNTVQSLDDLTPSQNSDNSGITPSPSKPIVTKPKPNNIFLYLASALVVLVAAGALFLAFVLIRQRRLEMNAQNYVREHYIEPASAPMVPAHTATPALSAPHHESERGGIADFHPIEPKSPAEPPKPAPNPTNNHD